MPTPLFKSSIVDLSLLFILAVFVAFLWLDLRFIQEEIEEMQGERDLLALKVQEMRKDVEDRMKRNDLVDIWFPIREEALAFGVRNLKMEILSN